MSGEESHVASSVSVDQFYTKEAAPEDRAEQVAALLEECGNDGSVAGVQYASAHLKDLSSADRARFFEIDAVIDWIRKGGYQRVALQFPDSLLSNSLIVAAAIEKQLREVKTFVLADTTYRSCCVDDVAAAHASCDALVHFGDACLSSPTNNTPVKFVFGRLPVSPAALSAGLAPLAATVEADNALILLADAAYAHSSGSLQSTIESALGRPVDSCVVEGEEARGEEGEEREEGHSLGRTLPACLRQGDQAVTVVFIGDANSPLLPLWLMTHPRCQYILHHDPATGATTTQHSQSWRALRKRLFLVEKLRDARTVGLIVGSVGVAGHREAVARMREMCRIQQKKIYVVSVGKVNVPKLSNFSSDIDVFVLLSCPFGVLLDSSAFYRPVLSMFEAEVALNPSKQWIADGGWTPDFNAFVKDELLEESDPECDVDEEGDVSLITGRVRARQQREHGGGGAVQLYTAGDYFAERSWRGLDDSVRVDESTRVEEGRAGIAAGYHNEQQ